MIEPHIDLYKNNIFQKRLIRWYEENHRSLPWRDTRDPYRIWLSEIILQQTRVDQGRPYYEKFLSTFPTISDLAKSKEQDVLRLWQGLGYYSRARNLHFTAKHISNNYDGQFPATFQELLKLKGVGAYTAAAIASFAFDEQVAVVDGNVYRVLSRVFGIKEDISTNSGKKFFNALANELLPEKKADIYNQAIMEFGAMQCVPSSPDCENCVLLDQCYAAEHHMQKDLPVKSKKTKQRDRYFEYLVIEHGDRLLMKERGAKDIWQGLYDFPLLEFEVQQDEETILLHAEQEGFPVDSGEAILKEVVSVKKHLLSHQRIYARFWHLTLQQDGLKSFKIKNHLWLKMSELEKIPKPVLITNYLKGRFF